MGGSAKKATKPLAAAALGPVAGPLAFLGADLFGRATEQPDLPAPPPAPEAPDVAAESADTGAAIAERQRLERRRRRGAQTQTVIGGLGVNPTPGVARTVLGGGSGV
ncbi:MAG: hypothetical protein ACR2P3_00270 [Geminicoccaceae bacterium]